MLEHPLAPYLLWAKTREAAPVDLAGSNLLPCTIEDLPGARDALDIVAKNDNGYAPLVDAIARHYDVDPARVVSAAGCSGANFLTVAALIGAGDDVLVERPAYDPLVGACRLMGATVRRFDRRFERGYRLDLESIEAALTARTRLVIITTPHNPSGCILERDELVALGRLMEGRGRVLVDEVYLDAAELCAGRPPTARSAARLDGPFIVTNSLTKSYGLAGLKCGWVIASPNDAERIARTRDVVENAGSAPADRLGALAFTRLDRLGARMREIVGRNHATARTFMARQTALTLAVPIASSIMFPRLPEPDEHAFVEALLTRHGVAVAPGSFFGASGHIRISLAAHPDQVASGLDRLASFLGPQSSDTSTI